MYMRLELEFEHVLYSWRYGSPFICLTCMVSFVEVEVWRVEHSEETLV